MPAQQALKDFIHHNSLQAFQHNNVHPLLFRILCAFLDQGIAVESFPVAKKLFLESIKEMEQNSFVSFFKTKEVIPMLLGRYALGKNYYYSY